MPVSRSASIALSILSLIIVFALAFAYSWIYQGTRIFEITGIGTSSLTAMGIMVILVVAVAGIVYFAGKLTKTKS